MLPELKRLRKQTTKINVFRGLNRTPNTGFARLGATSGAVCTEFKDMKNMSADTYPILSARKPRSRIYSTTGAEISSNLLAVNGKMIYLTADGKLHYNGGEYAVSGYTQGEHTIVSYGNNVFILPEKKLFEIGSLSIKSIEVQAELTHFDRVNIARSADDISYMESCAIEKIDLDEYGKPRRARYKVMTGMDFTDESNQRPIDNQGHFKHQWLFTTIKEGETVESLTANPAALYKCYAVTGKEGFNSDNKVRQFVRADGGYVRITVYSGDWTKLNDIEKGDYIKISGMTGTLGATNANGNENAQAVEGLDIENTFSTDFPEKFNGKTFKILDKGGSRYNNERGFAIKADIESSIPYAGTMTVKRLLPPIDDDKMIEVNNRLWACSSETNEIFACRQGDCRNWQAYGDGISTDSYAATVGCEGDFTGIARQNDSVIFFKENWIIKLYGNKPSNYTLGKYNVPGVEKGSGKSLVWVNGVLYYLSPAGVCRYSPGGMPVVISDGAFGEMKYKNGVAGRHRSKYYLSAENENGEYELFVFDTENGIWTKEDGTRMLSAMTYNDVMYYVDAQTKMIMCVSDKNTLIGGAEGVEREGAFDWSCETGNLYENDFGTKFISKLELLADTDGKIKISAQFEDDGKWFELGSVFFEKRVPRRIPVRVRRSDYLRLRIEGSGKCDIYYLLIEYSGGSGNYGSI